jgi:hypothetical protein
MTGCQSPLTETGPLGLAGPGSGGTIAEVKALGRASGVVVVWLALLLPGVARAQHDDPPAVLDFQFTAAPRAQIAIWVEDAAGNFLGTVALTEATAFRGIGNRPGASQMNSGYRWPYGRREGVLPIWATRRAQATDAAQFRRVVFQDRLSEGRASRTSSDQSTDNYYCLSFSKSTTSRDALDAVSCASVFTSDKGRFVNQLDVNLGYAEPYEELGTQLGVRAALPLDSLYPPRMDVMPCTGGGCYDHPDLGLYPAHARSVMPEIDAVTAATPQGGEPQSWLFSVPDTWPAGSYVAWLEINVEGDYAPGLDAAAFPTPQTPSGDWDSWAIDYGYAYRGQPSVAFKVPFELGVEGDASYATDIAAGASSWDVWAEGFGELGPLTGIRNDPAGAPGSGVDRLLKAAGGDRLRVLVSTLRDFEPADPDAPPPTPPSSDQVIEPPDFPGGGGSTGNGEPGTTDPEAGEGGGGGGGSAGMGTKPPMENDDGVIIVETPGSLSGTVGEVEGLKLERHPDRQHQHEWVRMRLLAVEAEEGLHHYEVRVSDQPMTDEPTFLAHGRPAKTATEAKEGGASLMLPVDVVPGAAMTADIGGLAANTRWYVGVRAVDGKNRKGPISIASYETGERVFTTVTPCVIATAAYGTPLAAQVGVFRRFRDQFLASHAPGRWLIAAYYRHGPWLAQQVAAHSGLRAAVRGLLDPLAGWLAAP